jgi:transcriptional regulator with XRE-family HTH domain
MLPHVRRLEDLEVLLTDDGYDIRDEVREMLETEIKNQNLTNWQLGVRSGMAQSNVSNFLRGERVPRLDVLQRLAHGLGKRLVIRFE